MTLSSGSTIGPYEVLGILGAGGMGEVYRARDVRLGRDVALKIVPDVFAHDSDRLVRFRREAQVLASLNHANIGAIYGFEEAPVVAGAEGAASRRPVHALVLELVEGETLADLIARGPLALEDVLRIARQIADAVDAAHSRGIVHRDLKPGNIKVRPDGTVKVLDFGLAKALGPESAAMSTGTAPDLVNSPTVTSPAMTGVGMILGTAAYMAPEQAKGRSIDKRADIWAFGCVLYEMLTGRRAFDGDSVSELLANVLKTDPAWGALPADTPSALRRLVRRCLVKDPELRLPDIGVARIEIADAALDDGMSAAPGPGRLPDSRGASRWVYAVAAVAILALIGSLPLAIRHLRETPAETPAMRFDVPPPPGRTFASQLAVSPNGRLIVFRAQQGQQGADAMLWLRRLETMAAEPLRGTTNGAQPFWSPDGRWVAFIADNKLKKVEATGTGPVQTICDLPAGVFLGASWGPDGTILLGTVGALGDPDGSRMAGLVGVPAAGGSVTPVTYLDKAAGETMHMFPDFLPDGRFLYAALPSRIIYVGAVGSSERTQVMEGESIALHADGHLVFSRQGTLMAQPFDVSTTSLSGEPMPIAEEIAQVTVVGLAVFVASASADVLAYERGGSTLGGTPVWVGRDGRELGPVTADPGATLYPRLSPDGQRLAVVRDHDLWVYDLGGRPPIRLSFDGERVEEFTPIWTPDGHRIIYETTTPAPLSAVLADGGQSTPEPVSPPGHFHAHGFSKDGTEIVVTTLGGPNIADLAALVPLPSGEPRLLSTPAMEGGLGAAVLERRSRPTATGSPTRPTRPETLKSGSVRTRATKPLSAFRPAADGSRSGRRAGGNCCTWKGTA
jgi:hypothetical protein